jgi:hypothetical protein
MNIQNELTKEIAARLIADRNLSTKEYTSITPDAARILADGYKHTTLQPDPMGELTFTEAELDLSGLTTLDVESAKALAGWGQNGGACFMSLNLGGLTQLTPEIATALASWKPDFEIYDGLCSLILDGVTSASAEALEALAKWAPGCISTSLFLNGFKTLDLDQAKAISKWSGAGDVLQLSLHGLENVSKFVIQELAHWPGDQLGLGLRQLSPENAGILSGFKGTVMELPFLAVIDIATAKELFCTDVEDPQKKNVPKWVEIDLGSEVELMAGITPEVADWITDMRVCGIEVQLSKQSELAVYANCTFVEKKVEPETASLHLGGKHGIFFHKRIYCPFCAKLVGEPGDLEHETPWNRQWKIDGCEHLISVIGNGDRLLDICGDENPRKNAAGRVSIKVNAYFTEYVNADHDVHPDEDEMAFEFAPLFPEKTI